MLARDREQAAAGERWATVNERRRNTERFAAVFRLQVSQVRRDLLQLFAVPYVEHVLHRVPFLPHTLSRFTVTA